MVEDLYVRLDETRTLWLIEIARATFEDQGLEDLESDAGLFVVLEDNSNDRFEVLAKAASPWAGASLLQLIAASMTRQAA